MSLENQLTKIREASAKRIPEDKRAVLGSHTQELIDSGIMDRTIQVGDTLPPFALQNSNGAEVTSAGLLAQGMVVMTVFRGHW
jgi:hypothetical protein